MKQVKSSASVAGMSMVTVSAAIVGLIVSASTAASCPDAFSQNVAPDVIQQGSVACIEPDAVTSTGWARSWSAGVMNEHVCEVEFGVQQSGMTDEVTVNIYQGDIAGEFNDLTLIGSTTVTIAHGTEFELMTAVFDPPVAVDDEQPVIVEVFAIHKPIGAPPFFAGINWQGETQTSYVRAPACDLPNFTPMFLIGPNIHLVMTVMSNARLGDLNQDGVVDGHDLLILLQNWGSCKDIDDCLGDLNGDGVVDGLDLLALLVNWD